MAPYSEKKFKLVENLHFLEGTWKIVKNFILQRIFFIPHAFHCFSATAKAQDWLTKKSIWSHGKIANRPGQRERVFN